MADEFAAATELGEFQEHGESRHLCPGMLDEFDRGGSRAPGGENVVQDEDSGPGRHGLGP